MSAAPQISCPSWLPAFESIPGSGNPEPLITSRFQMLDTRGRSRDMTMRRWVWLIAKTDATDEALLAWAHSFSDPPSLQVSGAHIDFPSYSPERRAMRLVVDSPSVDIKLTPVTHTVNPVFELDHAPERLASVTINGTALGADAYAWDGKTLWMKASIGGANISLRFQ